MKSNKLEILQSTRTDAPAESTVSAPPNTYQEGIMTSRYVEVLHEASNSNSEMTLHSHYFYEILCCASAVDVEYLVGADRYRLQKGDIIFITPGTSHRPLLPERLQAPYHRDVIRISPEFFQNMLSLDIPIGGLIPAEPFLLRTAGTRWEYLADLFRWVAEEATQRNLGWELVVMSNICHILVHINRALLDRSAKPLHAEKPELLDQVLDYIETHMAEKITLAEISQRFFVSQSTITQTFRNKMGVSFYRCVTQRRLIAAKRMIEKGIAMDRISERVGFQDYSSFYRAFKQEYGISPRQYRMMQTK